MRDISEALDEHIHGITTSLATCWKIKRTDGVELGFTDHDRELTIDGLHYRASTGFTPSAIHSTSSMSVDNLEVEGMLSSDSLQEDEIMSGKYDFSEVEIFLVNYKELTQGKIYLRTGWLGEVSISKNYFVAEVRGLMQRLAHIRSEFYSASCRATLGDVRCKVDITQHSTYGSVHVAEGNNQTFTDVQRTEESGLYDGGKMTFLSGANAGVQIEVKNYIKQSSGYGQFILVLPLPYDLLLGDGYSVSKGCDKRIETCNGRFNNIINFRGEPSVPGLDRMLETAGTRSSW